MTAHAILDANLAALLSRAYEPMRPSGAFRARLSAALERSLAQRRSRAARSLRTSRVWRVAAAVLVVGLAALLAWRARVRPVDTEIDVEQLAQARGAVRVGSQAWREVSSDELRRGFELEAGSIALASPDRGFLRVWLGSVGRLDAGPASRLRVEAHLGASTLGVAPDGPGVAPAAAGVATAAIGALVHVELARGGLDLERYDSGPCWTITTPAGDLALERGALAVTCAPEDSAPHRVRARLASGSAFVETRSGRTALEIGHEVFFDQGMLSAVGGSELGGARGEPGTRTSAAIATRSEGPEGRESTEGPNVIGDSGVLGGPAPEPARLTLRGRVRAARGSDLEHSFTVTLLREVRLPSVAQPEEHRFDSPSGELAIGGERATGSEFAIDGVRPGTYSVFVAAPGFATWQRSGLVFAAPEATLDVELSEGCWLRGRVVAAEGGRPIEGAVVLSETDIAAQVVPFDFEGKPPSGPAVAVSAADGRFELASLSRGAHVLRASRPGFAAAWSERLALEAGLDAQEIELRLPRGGTIAGTVADDEGRPWPNAFVVATWLDYGNTKTKMSFGHALADGEGRYTIPDLRAGAYVVLNPLEATRSRQAVPRVFEARVEAGVETRVDLPGSQRGAKMQGRLLAADGVGLADQDLMLEPLAADVTGEGRGRWQSARTRADGSYFFSDLAPGAYAVYVGKGLGTHFVLVDEIEVPTVPVYERDLVLPQGRIRCRVVDAASGNELARSLIIIQTPAGAASSGGPRASPWSFAGKVMTDAQGRCEIEHMRAGAYRLIAYGLSGRYGPQAVEVWLDAQSPATAEIALARGAAVRMHVTSKDGFAVERAHVSIRDPSGQALEFSPEDATDPAGRFEIPGINSGRWIIRVEHSGFEPASLAIDLAVDEERALEIVLEPSAPK